VNYLISPVELETRRERCRPAVESIASVERQFEPRCNLCGSEHSCVVANRDRYGLPLRTAICTNCGLVYMTDRLTQEGYSEFYRGGAYRRLTSSFAGSAATIEDLQADQAAYAKNLILFLEGRVPRRPGVRLLDVGGSSGQVAKELAHHFGVEATVLDPSEEEIEAAQRLGLRGVVGSAETWHTDEQFDLVLLCRTVEHLFDLRATMAKLRRYLRPGGLFYCDFLDYMELCRMTGAPQTVSKVDHCYWLTIETAPAHLRAMGFEIVSLHVAPKPPFTGLLLRPCEEKAIEPLAWNEVQPRIRELQQILADWLRTSSAPASLPARVRYKVKRIAKGAVGR
jgi:SAM-dependent methyltransferase